MASIWYDEFYFVILRNAQTGEPFALELALEVEIDSGFAGSFDEVGQEPYFKSVKVEDVVGLLPDGLSHPDLEEIEESLTDEEKERIGKLAVQRYWDEAEAAYEKFYDV